MLCSLLAVKHSDPTFGRLVLRRRQSRLIWTLLTTNLCPRTRRPPLRTQLIDWSMIVLTFQRASWINQRLSCNTVSPSIKVVWFPAINFVLSRSRALILRRAVERTLTTRPRSVGSALLRLNVSLTVLFAFTTSLGIAQLRSWTQKPKFLTTCAKLGALIKLKLNRLPVVSSASTNVSALRRRTKTNRFSSYKWSWFKLKVDPALSSANLSKMTQLCISVSYPNSLKSLKRKRRASFSAAKLSVLVFLAILKNLTLKN